MLETTFHNLDDALRKDAGYSSELDNIEQKSWVLFLKYLDDFDASLKFCHTAYKNSPMVVDFLSHCA